MRWSREAAHHASVASCPEPARSICTTPAFVAVRAALDVSALLSLGEIGPLGTFAVLGVTGVVASDVMSPPVSVVSTPPGALPSTTPPTVFVLTTRSASGGMAIPVVLAMRLGGVGRPIRVRPATGLVRDAVVDVASSGASFVGTVVASAGASVGEIAATLG